MGAAIEREIESLDVHQEVEKDYRSKFTNPVCPDHHSRLFRSEETWKHRDDLEPATYQCRDLINWVIHSFNNEEDLRDEQQEARREFCELLSKLGEVDEKEERFKRYFSCLDTFYFGGNLSKYMTVTWHDRVHPFLDRNGDAGENRFLKWPHARIRMVKPDRDELQDLAATEVREIGTALHECVHAFIMIFSCPGPRCERNILNGKGVSGHGTMWMTAVNMMEQDLQTWHPSLNSVNPSGREHDGRSRHIGLEREDASVYVQGVNILPLVVNQNPNNLFTLHDNLAVARLDLSGATALEGEKQPAKQRSQYETYEAYYDAAYRDEVGLEDEEELREEDFESGGTKGSDEDDEDALSDASLESSEDEELKEEEAEYDENYEIN